MRQKSDGIVVAFIAKPGKVVLAQSIFQLLAVSDADRKAGTVSQDTGLLIDGADKICIDQDSPVGGQKSGIVIGQPKKILRGHTGAQAVSVFQLNIQIMGVIYNRHNIRQKQRDGLSTADNADSRFLLREISSGIFKNLKNPVSCNRLGNVVKGMAGKSIRHKIAGGSKKNQNTGVIDFPQLPGSIDTVDPFHKDIHKNNLIKSELKVL